MSIFFKLEKAAAVLVVVTEVQGVDTLTAMCFDCPTSGSILVIAGTTTASLLVNDVGVIGLGSVLVDGVGRSCPAGKRSCFTLSRRFRPSKNCVTFCDSTQPPVLDGSDEVTACSAPEVFGFKVSTFEAFVRGELAGRVVTLRLSDSRNVRLLLAATAPEVFANRLLEVGPVT